MERNLVIVGAGGFGRETAWLVERLNQKEQTWNLLGFVDDNQALRGKELDGYPVLGGVEYLSGKNLWAVCAIGSAKVRKKVVQRIAAYPGIRFATLIDPGAVVSGRVSIGEGSIICLGTIITVDIKIGRHVHINLDCTLGHDDVVGDYTTLYPSVNVSGMVKIKECVEIGTGAKIIQGIEIGARTIIGAGASVIRPLPEDCTAVGVPTRLVHGG